MSKTIKHDCFTRQGVLTDAIVNEHIVPSLGIGAAETIRKAGWDGESAALAVGLTIAPTGEHIRSAKAFGVGFHDNSWTFSSSKLWGGKEGYKIALNLKDLTSLSFPGNLMYTTYINCDDVSWYAYKSVGERSKLNKSDYEACDIKKFCVRASVQLVDAKTARISYGIVPVSLEELKREYLEHMNKAGFPNILYQHKDIPFVPLAEDDWELPSTVVPLFVDERVGEDNNELPEANEIWLRFSQFLRSSTSPNLVKNCDEWVAYLSDNPTFEASPSEFTWPLFNDKPSQRVSGEEYFDISLSSMPTPTGLDPYLGTGCTHVNLWV